MCVGIAVLCGPPTVAGCCYATWLAGEATVVDLKKLPSPPFSVLAGGTGLGAAIGAYKAQNAFVIRHFDEGGFLSWNFKKGAESLGEPLKIATWKDFYRASGPPVFARTAALVFSFYLAGATQAVVAYSLHQPRMHHSVKHEP
ncbi:hypothetical protein CYMTET_41366 [Cymbomonas tetramitiformis]|uniref:Transmembrane protein n=1 Tax=Cymbomonas tetramitiformis TaxID=36881 RepID=A0AAE0C7N1_9CHLO|nr:hypothetical protein CYMTET_41366 [Cymbomonas tetramitiformis]